MLLEDVELHFLEDVIEELLYNFWTNKFFEFSDYLWRDASTILDELHVALTLQELVYDVLHDGLSLVVFDLDLLAIDVLLYVVIKLNVFGIVYDVAIL